LSFHAATITLGYPHASALRYRMRRRTPLRVGLAAVLTTAHQLDCNDKFHKFSLNPLVPCSSGTNADLLCLRKLNRPATTEELPSMRAFKFLGSSTHPWPSQRFGFRIPMI